MPRALLLLYRWGKPKAKLAVPGSESHVYIRTVPVVRDNSIVTGTCTSFHRPEYRLSQPSTAAWPAFPLGILLVFLTVYIG